MKVDNIITKSGPTVAQEKVIWIDFNDKAIDKLFIKTGTSIEHEIWGRRPKSVPKEPMKARRSFWLVTEGRKIPNFKAESGTGVAQEPTWSLD